LFVQNLGQNDSNSDEDVPVQPIVDTESNTDNEIVSIFVDSESSDEEVQPLSSMDCFDSICREENPRDFNRARLAAENPKIGRRGLEAQKHQQKFEQEEQANHPEVLQVARQKVIQRCCCLSFIFVAIMMIVKVRSVRSTTEFFTV
jgi:hypothetical protein